MSNRTYSIVLSVAAMALVAALVASYFMHRLTISPVAIYLLGFLIVIPAMSAVRLLTLALIVRIAPGLQERMREHRERDPLPAYAVWTCVGSFAASFLFMMFGALLVPLTSQSNALTAGLTVWLGFFLYGWLGLIYTSRWVQTHGIAIAFAAIPTIGLSAALLFGLGAYPELLSRFLLIPIGLSMYGLFMIMTPIFVSFSRATDLID